MNPYWPKKKSSQKSAKANLDRTSWISEISSHSGRLFCHGPRHHDLEHVNALYTCKTMFRMKHDENACICCLFCKHANVAHRLVRFLWLDNQKNGKLFSSSPMCWDGSVLFFRTFVTGKLLFKNTSESLANPARSSPWPKKRKEKTCIKWKKKNKLV